MVIALIASLVAALLVVWGTTHYNDLTKRAQVGDMRGQVLETTTGIIADTDATDVERRTFDNVVGTARSTYNDQLERVKQNEPTVRERADRPVPDSLRKLAAERRRARERSGRTDERSEEERRAQDATER